MAKELFRALDAGDPDDVTFVYYDDGSMEVVEKPGQEPVYTPWRWRLNNGKIEAANAETDEPLWCLESLHVQQMYLEYVTNKIMFDEEPNGEEAQASHDQEGSEEGP